MSQKPHPKAQRIDALLLRFFNTKQICAELGVDKAVVHHRAEWKGFRRYYVDEEEVALLKAHRENRIERLEREIAGNAKGSP